MIVLSTTWLPPLVMDALHLDGFSFFNNARYTEGLPLCQVSSSEMFIYDSPHAHGYLDPLEASARFRLSCRCHCLRPVKPTDTLYPHPDKNTVHSFDFGESVLTLSCSAIATTTPSLTRFMIPRMWAMSTCQTTSKTRARRSRITFPLTHPFPNGHQLRHNLHLLSLHHPIQICHAKRPTHPHHLPEILLPHQR
jgi:hypothetical protein